MSTRRAPHLAIRHGPKVPTATATAERSSASQGPTGPPIASRCAAASISQVCPASWTRVCSTPEAHEFTSTVCRCTPPELRHHQTRRYRARRCGARRFCRRVEPARCFLPTIRLRKIHRCQVWYLLLVGENSPASAARSEQRILFLRQNWHARKTARDWRDVQNVARFRAPKVTRVGAPGPNDRPT